MMSQSQTQQAPFFQEALFSNAGRDDGNIIAASKKILEVCLDLSVSDVHLEPQKNGLRIRGRMDGVLQDLMRRDQTEELCLSSDGFRHSRNALSGQPLG